MVSFVVVLRIRAHTQFARESNAGGLNSKMISFSLFLCQPFASGGWVMSLGERVDIDLVFVG